MTTQLRDSSDPLAEERARSLSKTQKEKESETKREESEKAVE